MKPNDLINSIKNQNLGPTVFIIGGGPSLLKTLPDRSVLNNHPVIATNNAYMIFPKALLCHFADRTWWLWHRDKLHTQFENPVSTCATPSVYNNVEFDKYNIVTFYHGERKGGFSEEKGKLSGNNAGHQAINIAAHLGFTNIILLGFDMNPTGKTSHWHDGHKRPTNLGNYEGTMIPGLKMLVPFQGKLGFTVYNTNPESNLKCFQFTDINEWI